MKHLSRPFQIATICLFILFFATGCAKKVDPITALEITVLDRTTNKPVTGVTVELYASYQDWFASISPVTKSKMTDANGVLTLTDGADMIVAGTTYYIDASKGVLDNYAAKEADLKVTATAGQTVKASIVIW
jgi:5-hydroxyisourate hydrolase-like protein (transthyretin family)